MASGAGFCARGIIANGFVDAARRVFPLAGGEARAAARLEACELLPWRARLWAKEGPRVGEVLGVWVANHGARDDRARWGVFARRMALGGAGKGERVDLWRECAGGGARTGGGLGSVLGRLAGAGLRDPLSLGEATRHELVLRLGRGWEADGDLRALWEAASARLGPGGLPPRLPMNAWRLAELIRGGSPDETAIGQRKLALEAACGVGGAVAACAPPRAWRGLLSRRGGPSTLLARRLVEYTAAFNVLSSFGRSLPSVASALRGWAGFCDALGVGHFPVTGELARDYARAHREEETYTVYLGHVRKACELLGLDTTWARASGIKAAKRGLAAAAPRFKPPREAVGFRDLARLVALRPAASASKLFVLLSWVFMLRAASEGAGVVRVADDSAALDESAPPSTAAAIGLWGGKVALRLKRRKNKPRGDLVLRGCSCGGEGGLSRHCAGVLCPVCVFWPVVRRKFAAGDSLFPSGIAARAGEWLRAGLREVGVLRWDRYSLHALRRGAARALVEKGGDLADLCRAGSWSSTAVLKFYLGMKDVERRALVADASSSESEQV